MLRGTKLIPVVLHLVDQDVLADLELVVGQLAVAILLGFGSLIMQRHVYYCPIGLQLLEPVPDGLSACTMNTVLIKVGDLEEESGMVAKIEVVGA